MTGRCRKIVARLKSLANPANVAGMARYGINPKGTLGVSIPVLRKLARECGRDQAMADELWATGIHEARILAGLVAEPARMTPARMEAWALDFDSWDVCDGVCSNLFDRTASAQATALAWSARPEEFVKRAGFVIMAALAVHDKKAGDAAFRPMLEAVEREAGDERNFVKKAVNWALRQIGKRNRRLNREAVSAARRIAARAGRAARWVARDALRELESEKVQARLK